MRSEHAVVTSAQAEASRERARLVKTRAAGLGFELAGVASAEPFDADLKRTLAWLQHGFQGEMGWMTPDRARTACDPETLLTGARSLVVVGASYGGPGDGEDSPARGRVARYARGLDYRPVQRVPRA